MEGTSMDTEAPKKDDPPTTSMVTVDGTADAGCIRVIIGTIIGDDALAEGDPRRSHPQQ